MVWLVWVYTTWVTNWLDPEHLAVRALLEALMLVSLVLSASLPAAFGARGMAVGVAASDHRRPVAVAVAVAGQPGDQGPGGKELGGQGPGGRVAAARFLGGEPVVAPAGWA